jgi:hypothetical protein
MTRQMQESSATAFRQQLASVCKVIRARPELVARLPLETDLTHPVDVDTPADYERIAKRNTGIG